MLAGWPLVVVGVALLALGVGGVSGVLDRSRFSLYSNPDPERRAGRFTHRRMQRVGGAVMFLGGALFIWSGARGL